MNESAMHRCLELAACGRGMVGNGAMVGAVLVRGDKIIGEAFHAAFGEAHAERALLESLKDSVQPDDVLYVNLEPCCHRGKTPPCTDIIIEKGIQNVVVGMCDPDTRVAGKGIEALRKAGITVAGPLLPELCERLNRGYVSVRTKNRPWLTLHQARMLDTRIANPDGSFLKITSPEQDAWSHEFLRARHDAILVGVGTVITDNPKLTIRLNKNSDQKFPQPYRLILDPNLRVPDDVSVLTDVYRHRTILFVAKGSSMIPEIRKSGISVVEVTLDSAGRFVWEELWEVLLNPRGEFYGITSVLIEGGPKTWKTFLGADLIDELVMLMGKN